MLENSRDRFVIPSCGLYHREVGIHTFELLYFFSESNRYEHIERVWQFLTRKCRRYSHNHYQFTLCHGLRAELLNSSVGQSLKMLVNPRVMVHGELGYLGITDCRSDILTDCRFIFNDFWERHGLAFIKMEYCLANRIDLCMGIEFLEPFSIPDYLDLLKRTPHKNTYRLLSLPDPEDERHSFKIANKRRGLVVYDKVYEQNRFSKSSVELGLNLMRIEYQFYPAGLRKLSREQGIADRYALFTWLMSNAPETICQGIQHCLEITPYRSIEKVKAEIEKQTSWHESTRVKMKKVQQYLYQQGTYDSLVEEMRCQKKMSELYGILERYRQLELSPTTLRKRSGRIYMPSLFMLALYVLRKEFEEE